MPNDKRSPNDQRSDVKNDNNEEFEKDRQNRERQLEEKAPAPGKSRPENTQ